jgi:hypothetical protein
MKFCISAIGLTVLMCVSAESAGRGVPLVASFFAQKGTGVSGDGNAYADVAGGVQCYFGAAGNELDLITYKTPRTLRFTFDPASSAWKSSGLPQNFIATVDLHALNHYGDFSSMRADTTAQANVSLQFRTGAGGRSIYELQYQSLAVKRTSPTAWHVTSDPDDIGGDPGFHASSQAALSMVRRRGSVPYGAVNMPIRFDIVLK